MSITRMAEEALTHAQRRGWTIATAESCTGGMVSSALTGIPGASEMFERGFVTYSNESKQEMLGVAKETIESHGAVSGETAAEMAKGALAHSRADIAISVTGIAGPDGGTPEKPVGLVWFGVATRNRKPAAHRRLFEGTGRAEVRNAAVETALELLLEEMKKAEDQAAAPSP